jgi:hypothetical protein
VVAATFSTACADGNPTPDRLMDGTKATAPPVDLEGLDHPAVLTKVSVVLPSKLPGSTRSASCLKGSNWGVRPQGSSVERVGVTSESVTFEAESGRGVFGCSNSPGAREDNRRWCGIAYGQFYGGRLRDPRLDILCGTQDEPVGSVWVQPATGARYVSVEQPGFAEVYEVAGGLPVRVATISGVEYERSRASFDLLEHAADGRLLRRYRLDAAVAG